MIPDIVDANAGRKATRFGGLGWQPDLPDVRDRYKIVAPVPITPTSNVRDKLPTVAYNQGRLGSCTGQGVERVWRFANFLNGTPDVAGSRLFIYFCERVLEGTVREDSGAQIRDGIKSITRWGCPPEEFWPYDIAKFTKRPPMKAYRAAKKEQALLYERIPCDLNTMKSVLCSGFPFVFGFSVYSSFETDDVANTGIMPVPKPDEQLLGGHCVTCEGHDDNRGAYLCRNSWGEKWGIPEIPGHFWMPYDVLGNSDMADDRWVVTKVE